MVNILPCCLWFVWKTRNLKVFENKDIAPDITFAIANQEAEAFRAANIHNVATTLVTIPQESPPALHRFICQTDGSCTATDSRSGHGWILNMDGKVSHLGLKNHRRSTSPLHAEFDTLLWDMHCLTDSRIF